MEVIADGRTGTGESYLFIAMDVKTFVPVARQAERTLLRDPASLLHAHRPHSLRPRPPVPPGAARKHHPRLRPGAVRAAPQRRAAAARAGRLCSVLPPARAPKLDLHPLPDRAGHRRQPPPAAFWI